jgi:gliding motility-associated-like protein
MNISIKHSLMNNIKICLFSILTFMLLPSIGNATHIVGGDITYKKISDNPVAKTSKFLITMNLRRDCFLGAANAEFDKNAKIRIFRSNGSLFLETTMPFMEDDTLNNYVQSDCGFEGTQVCVHETRYLKTIDLPFLEGGYTIAYQRCCRNGSINNIIDPLEVGATYSVNIPTESFTSNNSSPSFKQWPAVYICANENINFDNAAIDPDGDSLVYKLCTPKIGLTKSEPEGYPSTPPYTDLNWKVPYGLNNLMGGVPLSINPKTGFMTAIPNVVGQYVIGVCVEEWRKGKKIGEIRRDFQYNVRVCSPPPTAVFTAPSNLCNERTVTFVNNSTVANAYEWNFNFPSTDPAFKSTEKNPTFTFPSTGTYQVKLSVVRNSDNCRDEEVKTIKITDLPYNADFAYEIKACNPDGTLSVFLTDNSKTDDVGAVSTKWNWTLTQNGVTKTSTTNPAEFIIDPANFGVTFAVNASNACSGSISKTVDFTTKIFESDFKVELAGCDPNNNLQIKLIDLSQDLNDNYVVDERKWKVTYNNTTVDLFGNNVITSIPRTNYTVSLDVNTDKGCKNTVTKNFVVTDFIPSADFDFSLSGCNVANEAIMNFTEKSNDAVNYATVSDYSWSFKNLSLNGQTVDYTTNLKDSFDMKLTLKFANNCTVDVSKTVSVNQLRPKVAYSYIASDCPDDNNVNLVFKYEDAGNQGLGNTGLKWNIGNATNIKTYSGNTFTATIPKDSLIIGTLTTEFNNGCKDEIEKQFIPGPFATLKLISDSLVLCPNEKVALITGGNPLLDYTWTPTLGLDILDQSNPILTGIQDQVYEVIVSDGICNVKGKVVVEVLESIALEIEGEQFTCDGNITLKVDGAKGPGVYSWFKDKDFTEKVGEGQVLTTSFNTLEQTYYAKFLGEVCSAEPATIKVVNQTPQFDIASPYMFCLGDTIKTNNVFNLVAEHNNTIVWEPNPHIIDGGNTINPTVGTLPGDKDGFTLYFNSINQYNCKKRDSLKFEIIPNPVVDFSFNVKDCGKLEVCFKLDTVKVDKLYGLPKWEFGDNKTLPGNTVCNIYNKPGEYQVKLSNLTSLCPFKDVVKTIKLNESFPTFDNNKVENCINSDYTLNLPAKAQGRPFVWFDNTGKFLSSDPNPKVSVKSDTSFILNVKDDNGCPFNDTIFIKAFIYDTDLTVPNEVCTTGNYQITAAANAGINFGYEWSPSNAIVSGGNTATPTVDVAKATKYKVKLTHPTLAGCTTEDSVSFNFFKFDVKLDVPLEVCETGIYQITSTANPGINFKYEWSPANAIVSGGNKATPTVDVSKSKKFTAKLTHPDLGCITEETVEFKTFKFEKLLDIPELFCINSTAQPTITVAPAGINYIYEWSPANLIVAGGNTASPTVSVKGNDEIKVKVTHPTLGCVVRDSFKITTSSLSLVVDALPNMEIAKGQEVEVFIVDPKTGWKYNWSNGFEGIKQTITITQDTLFMVTATDEKGCTGETELRLKIRDPRCVEDVFIPTAFSPNRDGTNDVLYVRSAYITDMELIIYNRWGQEVFASKNISDGWDGTLRGDELSPDVYAYWLRAQCSDGEEINKRGNVSLLR